MAAMIAVYVVTYRRPHLLRRALASVQAQTYTNWEARIVNDDPDDTRVAAIVNEYGDSRIRLYEPVRKRGAAGAFNEAFRARDCEFASLLEDDNWWEPRFLEVMTAALEQHPHVDLACMNERIWREESDGTWTDTGRLVWENRLDSLYATSLSAGCGSAKLCNSSLLFRRNGRPAWTTPDDLPVDVTEHFRERIIPQPFLLVGEPLVNYAETLQTTRTKSGTLWGDYQCLLVGSCFASLPSTSRSELAKQLFQETGDSVSPRVTTLLATALSCPEARPLLGRASAKQLTKFALTIARRPRRFLALFILRNRLARHWEFLMNSPWNRKLSETTQYRDAGTKPA